jgi:signal transduction histidine kinase
MNNLTKQLYVEQIIDAITQIAAGNLEIRIPISREFEYLDGIASGINMLAEEIEYTHCELKKTNEELEERVKQRTEQIDLLLKQKDEFIYQLGHDLKNPIGPFIQLLPILEKQTENPRQKQMIQVLLRNAYYIKKLISKTLTLARLNSPSYALKSETINLKCQVDEIIKNNMSHIEEMSLIVSNYIPQNIIVNADKIQIQEVLTNLLDNSICYSNPNSTISFHAEEKDDEIIVSISDDGLGMTETQLNQIFNEFYKADTSRHNFNNSGLGMSIIKKIVEKHGGRTWAESEGLGQGSTFFFTLPLATNVQIRDINKKK